MQGGNKTSAPLEGLSDIKSPKTVLNSPRQSNLTLSSVPFINPNLYRQLRLTSDSDRG